MSNKIDQAEKAILRVLRTNPSPEYRLVELTDSYSALAELFRDVSDMREEIYLELAKASDPTFKSHTAVTELVADLGNVIAGICDGEQHNVPSVTFKKYNEAIQHFTEIGQLFLDIFTRYVGIQNSPSLYGLNGERKQEFTDPKLVEFAKQPSVKSMYECMHIMHRKYALLENADFDNAITKLKPMIDKMDRMASGLLAKANAIYSEYVTPFVPVVEEVLIEDAESNNPYIIEVSDLSRKIDAAIESTGIETNGVKDITEQYNTILRIMKKVDETYSEIASDFKDQVDIMRKHIEEQASNNMISIGKSILELCEKGKVKTNRAEELSEEAIASINSVLAMNAHVFSTLYNAFHQVGNIDVSSGRNVKGANLGEAIDLLGKMMMHVQTFTNNTTAKLKADVVEMDKIKTKVDTLMRRLRLVESASDYVCVYKEGVAVFGVAKTRAEAVKQASKWVDADELKGLKSASCTQEVYDYFSLNGTPDNFSVKDGVLVIQ